MGEPISSPIGRSINAIRRRFSASTFIPPQGGGGAANQQVDPELTKIIIRNTNAVNTVTVQLKQVANQVNVLTQTLSAISQSLSLSSQLEQQRANAETERQRQLATLGLREGKESAIEQKIVNATMKPIEVLGKKATSILNRLGTYFGTILLGWLSTDTLKDISAAIAGDKEALTKIKNRFFTFLGIGVGLIITANTITTLIALKILKLGDKFKGFVFKGLKKPFISLINTIRVSAGAMPKPGGFRFGDDIPPNFKIPKNTPLKGIGNFFNKIRKSALPLLGVADAAKDINEGKNPIEAVADSAFGVTLAKIVTSLQFFAGKGFRANITRLLLGIGSYYGGKFGGRKLRESTFGKSDDSNIQSTSDQQTNLRTDTGSNVNDSDITPSAMSDDNKPKGNSFMKGLAGTADTFTGNIFDFDKQNESNLIKASTSKKELNKQSNLQLEEPAPQVVDMSMGGNNMGNEMTAPTSSSGTGSMGGSVPNIPANNNSNDYIYNSMREYQITVR